MVREVPKHPWGPRCTGVEEVDGLLDRGGVFNIVPILDVVDALRSSQPIEAQRGLMYKEDGQSCPGCITEYCAMSWSRDRSHEYVHLESKSPHESKRGVLARSGFPLTTWSSLSFGLRVQILGEEYSERNNSLQNLFEGSEVRVEDDPLTSVIIQVRVAVSPNQPTFVSCAQMKATTDSRSKRHMDDDDCAGHYVPYWAKSDTWWNSSRMEVDEGAEEESAEEAMPAKNRFSKSVHVGRLCFLGRRQELLRL